MNNSPMQSNRGMQTGFTLVELMVVIAVTVALLAIGALIFPSLADRQYVANGSDLTQQWLLTARQWAARDQQPRGLRVLNNGGTTASQLQYIGVLNDFSGGQLIVGAATPTNNPTSQTITLQNIDVTGGWYPSTNNWPIAVNDKLEIMPGSLPGATSLYQITSITPTTNPSGTICTGGTLVIQPPLPATGNPSFPPGFQTRNYVIHRAPRPLPGEPPLQLPTDIVIDLALGFPSIAPPSGNNPPTNWASKNSTYDLVFSPMGNVVLDLPAGTSPPGKIILWLRDGGSPQFQGEQRLVAVYVNTGAIAAHPANPKQDQAGNYYKGDPFSFVRDGQGSGM